MIKEFQHNLYGDVSDTVDNSYFNPELGVADNTACFAFEFDAALEDRENLI